MTNKFLKNVILLFMLSACSTSNSLFMNEYQVTFSDSKPESNFKFTLLEPTYGELYSLDDSKNIKELKINEKLKLFAYVKYSGIFSFGSISENLIWESSDNSIASVNNNGEITGKNLGNVEITAKYKLKPENKNIFHLEVVETLSNKIVSNNQKQPKNQNNSINNEPLLQLVETPIPILPLPNEEEIKKKAKDYYDNKSKNAKYFVIESFLKLVSKKLNSDTLAAYIEFKYKFAGNGYGRNGMDKDVFIFKLKNNKWDVARMLNSPYQIAEKEFDKLDEFTR